MNLSNIQHVYTIKRVRVENISMVNLNYYSRYNRSKYVYIFLCNDFWLILSTQICRQNGNLLISHEILDPDIYFLRILKTNYSIVPIYIYIYYITGVRM